MKLGRILVAGIAVGVVNIIWGFLTCGRFFNWVYALEPTFIWKTVQEMPFGLLNLAGLVFAVLLALVYAVIKSALPGKGIVKGISFGLLIWLIGTLPGNFGLGMFTRINSTVIIYWIVSGLVVNLLYGLVIAAIYR
jgi:hypothetical protein